MFRAVTRIWLREFHLSQGTIVSYRRRLRSVIRLLTNSLQANVTSEMKHSKHSKLWPTQALHIRMTCCFGHRLAFNFFGYSRLSKGKFNCFALWRVALSMIRTSLSDSESTSANASGRPKLEISSDVSSSFA